MPKLTALHHKQVFNQLLWKADAVAVSVGPGIAECLQQAIDFAKRGGWTHKFAVHHVHAHLAMALPRQGNSFPFLGIVMSGGHTLLALSPRYKEYIIMGASYDENIGDVVDKTLRMMGTPPNGDIYSWLDDEGLYESVRKGGTKILAYESPKSLNFSFSGLRSQTSGIECIAAAFNHVFSNVNRALDVLSDTDLFPRAIVASGGVLAGSLVRSSLRNICTSRKIKLHLPSRTMCTDNAVMIGKAAFLDLANGKADKVIRGPVSEWPLNELKADE